MTRTAFMVGFFDPVAQKWTHRVFSERERAQGYLDAADETVGPLAPEHKKEPEQVKVPKQWALPSKLDMVLK